jgi:hypothetical protein
MFGLKPRLLKVRVGSIGLVGGLLVLCSACAHTPDAEALQTAKGAAVFDLNCDVGAVQAAVISKAGSPSTNERFEVGARGCGRTETYRIDCNWTGCTFVEDRLRVRQKNVEEKR